MFLTLLGTLAAAGAIPTAVYVSSTAGSDTNAGTSPDAPLRTLPVAFEKAAHHQAVALFLRGIFHLNETVAVTHGLAGAIVDQWPRDAGTVGVLDTCD